jgi:hypothetical protein
MTETLDLSGAHPAHWPEARRRIAVIRRFLALKKPTARDLAHDAADLSMSADQFRRLVKAWSRYGDAGRLPGIRPARPLKRHTHNLISPSTSSIISAVIRQMPEDAASTDIFDAVVLRCVAEAAATPSLGTVCAAMMDERARRNARGEHTTPAKLVVGACWVAVPFEVNGRIVMPRLSLAVLAPLGHVVAWKWDGSDDRRFEVLADAICSISDETAESLPIRAHLPDVPLAWSLGDRLREAGAFVEHGLIGTLGASDVAAIIGKRIGDLRLVLRARPEHATRLLRDRQDQPVSSEDMSEVIGLAIDRHNAERVARDRPYRLCRSGATLSGWLRSQLQADDAVSQSTPR